MKILKIHDISSKTVRCTFVIEQLLQKHPDEINCSICLVEDDILVLKAVAAAAAVAVFLCLSADQRLLLLQCCRRRRHLHPAHSGGGDFGYYFLPSYLSVGCSFLVLVVLKAGDTFLFFVDGLSLSLTACKVKRAGLLIRHALINFFLSSSWDLSV